MKVVTKVFCLSLPCDLFTAIGVRASAVDWPERLLAHDITRISDEGDQVFDSRNAFLTPQRRFSKEEVCKSIVFRHNMAKAIKKGSVLVDVE